MNSNHAPSPSRTSNTATLNGSATPRLRQRRSLRSRLRDLGRTTKNIASKCWKEIKNFTTLLWIEARPWRAPLAALMVFTLVVSFALTDYLVNGPLARLGTTYGFLVLAILSKLTDYSLLAAADAAWEQVKWRKRPPPNETEPLLTFLALSTGFFGWLRILSLDFTLAGFTQRLRNAKVADINKNLVAHPRFLSLARLLIWAFLQLPAVVFLALVIPTTSFRTTQWNAATGGTGIYDPSLIPGNNSAIQFQVSSHVLNILSDRAVSFPVNAVSKNCSKSSTCASYLLPGGSENVSPWPFAQTLQKPYTAYVTRNTPSYQIDAWEAPQRIKWADSDCTKWGPEGGSFQLCLTAHGNSQIVAGLRICSPLEPNPEICNSWISWSMFISISRRTARVAFDLKSLNILAASDLGPAKVQLIEVDKFALAFRSFLYPTELMNSFDVCRTKTISFQVSNTIGSLLLLLKLPETPVDVRLPRDLLLNMFATPLHHFNPMRFTDELIDPLKLYEKAPPENHIEGSIAQPISHLLITRWTIYVYIGVSGSVLLVAIGYLTIRKLRKEIFQPSEFPIVDALIVQCSNGTPPIKGFEELFEGIKEGDNKSILNKAKQMKVVRKRRPSVPIPLQPITP